jgi:hypothetical protein
MNEKLSSFSICSLYFLNTDHFVGKEGEIQYFS